MKNNVSQLAAPGLSVAVDSFKEIFDDFVIGFRGYLVRCYFLVAPTMQVF